MSTSPVPVGLRLLMVLGACTLGATWLARAGYSPPAPRQDLPFVTNRRVEVTPATPLILPYAVGDCDVLATVEVPAAGELDVVVRRVQPAGGHGRFSLLRLSAVAEGPAWRSRDSALFDPGTGGVKVAAGLPASVRLELRGTRVTGNVAGRSLPPCDTADDRGDLALVVRGGTAVLNDLKLSPMEVPWSRRWPLLGGCVCGLVGVLGLILAARCVGMLRLGLATLLVPAAVCALVGWLDAEMVAASRIGASGFAVGVGAMLALCAVWLVGRRSMWLLRTAVTVVVAALGLELLARAEASRLRGTQDPRLDFYFGLDSRQAPFDALAKQLHGKNEVHGIELPKSDQPARERVVFLGGEPLFEAGLDHAQHLAVQVTTNVASDTGRNLMAAVVPTAFPHTLQQIELYRRFYATELPAVAVVLGIDRWEADLEPGGSARQRRAALRQSAPAPWSLVLALLARVRDQGIVAPPEELVATVDEFVTWCGEQRLPLVLATHARLPAAHLAALSSFARGRRVPLVVDVMDGQDQANVPALTQALASILRR